MTSVYKKLCHYAQLPLHWTIWFINNVPEVTTETQAVDLALYHLIFTPEQDPRTFPQQYFHSISFHLCLSEKSDSFDKVWVSFCKGLPYSTASRCELRMLVAMTLSLPVGREKGPKSRRGRRKWKGKIMKEHKNVILPRTCRDILI